MNIHQLARDRVSKALELHYGTPPSLDEIRVLAGVGWLESNYSLGWALTKKDPSLDPNNEVCNQCGSQWKGDSFSGTDTHPNPDGSSTPYPAAFRKYPQALAETDNPILGGWNDAVLTVYCNRGRNSVRIAAKSGDFRAVSTLLHSTTFYEGFGSTVASRIEHHLAALSKGIVIADNACGYEPVPTPWIHPLETPPTIRLGDKGPAVQCAQWELQVAADSDFGPITQAAVVAYERAHGLAVDTGVIGPQVWHSLFTDDYIPPGAPSA